jgi:hypothetical protein
MFGLCIFGLFLIGEVTVEPFEMAFMDCVFEGPGCGLEPPALSEVEGAVREALRLTFC